ncbi:MAG TPA: penicillin-binding transpeptidase domain-containing protein [Deltaproteobacteria bacterium]|nr:penicillin-binding transpeptidase domain-containing protein [Deltaproteobacteria bacterium]HQI00606.1 penicillin-binding transpeptidase domain-containing protein [Deltaproteobacteria bacterium]HQJ07535.1 penicillin-binding transpeptidase domain-containing protein [Deltaproteobacteria bacterium]
MESQFPFDSYPLRKKKKRRFLRLRYPLLFALLLIAAHFFISGREGGEAALKGDVPRDGHRLAKALKGQATPLTKKDLAFIDEETIKKNNLTIDWDLQQFIAQTASKYKLYYGSIVIMDAHTGDVLALYGQTRSGQDCSLSLNAELAASVFKLVTATAAIEQAGFTSQTKIFYTGSPYTLYKRQLTNKRDRWCADVTLADAFARSNNVVFGKIGTFYLGQMPIYLTAQKMGFWKPPMTDCEITPSTSFLPKDDYNLAELACGFNKQTRMSPLHAAQIVTPVLNGGYMLTPRIVRTEGVQKRAVMKKETAQDLTLMMERTVKAGTVYRTFRGSSSDRVLKHLDMGGKTGSIDGDDPKGRRNWFVGFARDQNTGKAITIGCLLILDDHFWIQADMFSRLVIRHYFSNAMDLAQTPHAKG